MSRMIFITGFARGGTSWLRDCVSAHPDVEKIPHEMVVFRDFGGLREYVEKEIEKAIQDLGIEAPFYVNKAPANAPFIGEAARALPESKFIFIIRDPRDVFISHVRGNQKWMGGKNSTVEGCMDKTGKYFKGYLQAKERPNVLLVRYEDLHQDFYSTLYRIFSFIGINSDETTIKKIFEKTNFKSSTGRSHVENRDASARKGVIGDWMLHLSKKDEAWFLNNRFWNDFFNQYGYDWTKVTCKNILSAMVDGGVHFLNEDEYLNAKLNRACPNALLIHDIDLIDDGGRRDSILNTAKIESELEIAAFYNFLPLDDIRYQKVDHKKVVELINKIKKISTNAIIGLHLNATEKFFPPDMAEVIGPSQRTENSITYLHAQIDEYGKYGVNFRTATAHGYGRGLKEPNNTSEILHKELGKRGIRLYDKDLRIKIKKAATHRARLHDVGGTIKAWQFPSSGNLTDPETYKAFNAGSIIVFLTHPGNYYVNHPLTVGVRINKTI